MRAAIYARMSTDKQSADSPADQIAHRAAAPADPRVRAFCDALAEAVANRILREIEAGGRVEVRDLHYPGATV